MKGSLAFILMFLLLYGESNHLFAGKQDVYFFLDEENSGSQTTHSDLELDEEGNDPYPLLGIDEEEDINDSVKDKRTDYVQEFDRKAQKRKSSHREYLPTYENVEKKSGYLSNGSKATRLPPKSERKSQQSIASKETKTVKKAPYSSSKKTSTANKWKRKRAPSIRSNSNIASETRKTKQKNRCPCHE